MEDSSRKRGMVINRDNLGERNKEEKEIKEL